MGDFIRKYYVSLSVLYTRAISFLYLFPRSLEKAAFYFFSCLPPMFSLTVPTRSTLFSLSFPLSLPPSLSQTSSASFLYEPLPLLSVSESCLHISQCLSFYFRLSSLPLTFSFMHNQYLEYQLIKIFQLSLYNHIIGSP